MENVKESKFINWRPAAINGEHPTEMRRRISDQVGAINLVSFLNGELCWIACEVCPLRGIKSAAIAITRGEDDCQTVLDKLRKYER